MLEIIFTVFLVTFMFSLLFIGVGVLNRRSISRHMKKMIGDGKVKDAVADYSVRTAAIDVKNRVMHFNPDDIARDVKKTVDTMYEAVKDDYKMLEKLGLDKVADYGEFAKYIEKSALDAIKYHEAGHIGKGLKGAEPNEVLAELNYAAKMGYNLSYKHIQKLIQIYSSSLYSHVKDGGEQGIDTAQKVYNELKNIFGTYAVDPIKQIVNAMLDTDAKVVYMEKKAVHS